MSRLHEILDTFYDKAFHETEENGNLDRSLKEAKQQIKELILSKEWHYYDPDELGEDAFKSLTEDEVSEL